MVDARFHIADAQQWVPTQPHPFDTVFTSPPDADEIGATPAEWAAFYQQSVRALIAATRDTGYVIIYATDRRADSRLWSKAHMIHAAAHETGAYPVWHKICYTSLGTNLFRPTYSHLIAVTRAGKPGRPSPDVIETGHKIYKNAVGANACHTVTRFLRGQSVTNIVDPYCGRGSIAYHAARAGISSVNVDIDRQQVQAAARLLGGTS